MRVTIDTAVTLTLTLDEINWLEDGMRLWVTPSTDGEVITGVYLAHQRHWRHDKVLCDAQPFLDEANLESTGWGAMAQEEWEEVRDEEITVIFPLAMPCLDEEEMR